MSLEKIYSRLRSYRGGRIALHLLLWLVYCSAMYYLESISFNSFKGVTALYGVLKNVATTVLVFYPLVYFVWPRYLKRGRYVAGVSMVVLLVVIYATADQVLEMLILQSCESCMERIRSNQNGYYNLLQRGAINVIVVRLITFGIVYQLFVFLAFPLTIKFVIEFFQQQLQTMRLQRENVQLEFNFLKSQVNPHFLFNTLNNIYALILKGEKDASAETVAKLAGFMRYSLYESNTHSNNILKEIDLLKDYVDLEKIRLNDTVVNFIHKTDNDSYSLPPLLFMPAVENAFKYCAPGKDGDTYIFLKLEIVDYRLVFVISNTFDETTREEKMHGGIGLQNLRKRLSHYYPGDNASLVINQTDKLYQVTIHIKLA